MSTVLGEPVKTTFALLYKSLIISVRTYWVVSITATTCLYLNLMVYALVAIFTGVKSHVDNIMVCRGLFGLEISQAGLVSRDPAANFVVPIMGLFSILN